MKTLSIQSATQRNEIANVHLEEHSLIQKQHVDSSIASCRVLRQTLDMFCLLHSKEIESR